MNKCIDCGKQVSTKETKRCQSCYGKILKGNGNPNFNKDNTHNNKCIICGVHITKYSTYCRKHATDKERHRLYGKHLDLKIRLKISQKITGMFEGKKHWNYKDGSAGKYPSEFFRIRKIIRKLYKYTCQLCHKFGKEVHHIDYDKNNNKKNNLILLCSKCHSKTNFNRSYWKNIFKR
jgi:5-methylcytosine-specific restriction endonuclease McrA